MSPRLGWTIAFALWVGVAAAAPPARTTKPAPRLAVAKHAAARASAKTKTAHRAQGSDTTATRPVAKGHEAPRTLQDIHIEGEIPVPQVLFITARDQRRFLDLQHRRYLRTSQQVGEQTVLPSWIGVTGNQPTDARKENPR